MVTGSKGYSAGKVRKLRAARTAVAKAATLLRSRSGGNLRAPLATYGWYGRYNRRGRTELKTIDTSINVSTSNAGSITLLNGIAQGNDYTNRDGRICSMQSIYFRFTVSPNSTTTTLNQGESIRIIIVYDCQTNGVAPTVANILQTGGDPHQPMNLNFRDRFKVIMDKQIGMAAAVYSAGALTNGSPTAKAFNFYKKLGMETVFQSTSNLSADIATGGIYLLIQGLSNGTCLVLGTSRVRFTDK